MDVFTFGAIMQEVVKGQLALRTSNIGCRQLSEWAWQMHDHCVLLGVVDQGLSTTEFHHGEASCYCCSRWCAAVPTRAITPPCRRCCWSCSKNSLPPRGIAFYIVATPTSSAECRKKRVRFFTLDSSRSQIPYRVSLIQRTEVKSVT